MIGTATVAVGLKGGFDPREIFFERDEGIYLRMSLYIDGPLFFEPRPHFITRCRRTVTESTRPGNNEAGISSMSKRWIAASNEGAKRQWYRVGTQHAQSWGRWNLNSLRVSLKPCRGQHSAWASCRCDRPCLAFWNRMFVVKGVNPRE